AKRSSAARIVAGHAADGGPGRGGNVDWKPKAMLLELTVEVIEHDPRLDYAAVVCDIKRDHAVQMLRQIDDDAVIDRLTALRGAAAPRRDYLPDVAADRQGPQRLVHSPGNNNSRRHDLIKRGIGRIAAAVKRIE